jgi:hypothetical protein
MEDPIAHILCYTIRDEVCDTDYWEVFPEYDGKGRTPLEQANEKLSLLIQHYEDEEHKLYTWNIAKIVKTNEWYNYDKGK